MKNESFLFIPDISGFTEFVNSTEIEHGQHIISELLEIIIASNKLKMTVSEVEGDAVLFYKYEQVPSIEDIIKQSETIFLNFHNHLQGYEVERICQCGACSTASELSVKMVAHACEIGFTSVNNVKKPYGADLVTVHKLLKTGIDEREYLLISIQYFDILKMDENELAEQGWSSKIDITSDFADNCSSFYYKSLSPLFDKLEEVKPPSLPKKQNNPYVLEIDIDNDKKNVFEVILNLDLRLRWNKSVNELLYDKNKLNRVGTKHQCLIGKTTADFQTITNDFGEDKLVYGEKVLGLPFVQDVTTYFVLSDNGDSTHLRFEIHIKAPQLYGWLIKPILISRLAKASRGNLELLKSICESSSREVMYETLS